MFCSKVEAGRHHHPQPEKEEEERGGLGRYLLRSVGQVFGGGVDPQRSGEHPLHQEGESFVDQRVVDVALPPKVGWYCE